VSGLPFFPPSARAKASEEKFSKLREVYQKLRSEHIVLLRTNGEAQKTLQVKEKEKSTMDDEVKVCKGEHFLLGWIDGLLLVCHVETRRQDLVTYFGN
jgi:hypothetical protein